MYKELPQLPTSKKFTEFNDIETNKIRHDLADKLIDMSQEFSQHDFPTAYILQALGAVINNHKEVELLLYLRPYIEYFNHSTMHEVYNDKIEDESRRN